MIGDVDPDDFEALTDDGDWFLSVAVPDETQAVAETLHEDGESYRNVGKLLNHHLSDLDEGADGLRLYRVRHASKPEHQGVVAVVPNSHWYEPITDIESSVGSYQAMVRFYGVPDDSTVLDLVKQEVTKRGWADSRIVTNHEYATAVESSLDADAEFQAASDERTAGYYVWE
ncbi:hypothetical protein [Halorussus halophilus]|uniref:hypothetical protein n=1 Tax=Halorussus halophilus TaxID=2650975 RepID=UPI00130139EE|nr:hypothetical protein [Halorussus halophilus]